ncbi:class I SAM-dependent methyltransferase [Algiphilus sp. W345]|uniref:Class I SAM-dependent methyltransferase n=1 Tax=Banduia mediterranea TaxID=3075609 RepID=A0ABU2WGR8_9GAMM|nr:class I SAM-dependent methyltransferase [Algiphilus sp. W345]MDT0496735.1 class I SAM-dependent methyltransferase [Algiphilus sp. W345]
MNGLDDVGILAAWASNAEPWTQAVREARIASRREVTDQAIVDAVLACGAREVLDLGCGEGWLARRLSQAGLRVTGVDAVAALVESARQSGGGEFHEMSYETLANGALPRQFDALVANFSLLGEQSVDGLIAAVPGLLNPGGWLLIQTLHPLLACDEQHPYVDGWRDGTWAGISGGFSRPAPWYFRTLHNWCELLNRGALQLVELREPRADTATPPASLLLVARRA